MAEFLDRDAEETRLRDKYEIEEHFNPLRFVPPGPVTQKFISDPVMTKALMGPLGGGKTTTCAFARLHAGLMMPPCRDGTIRDRFIVVRDTFRLAEKTVLASWQQWFPKDYPGSHSQGGNDRPFLHTLRFRLQDGTIVELETEFIGLGEHNLEDVLKGREISGAWANEMDTLSEGILRNLEGRTGRYPSKKDLADPNAPRKRTVLGDFNAPSIDNWTYSTFIENPTPDRKLFVQPGGMSRDAENKAALEPDYYPKIEANEQSWYVKRFVHNQFGYSRDGKPVYEAFDQIRHVSAGTLEPDENLPLLIGMDAGLKPAAIFGQPTPTGQIRLTDELIPGQGYGANRFGDLLVDLIARRYPNISAIQAWADPAAQYGADREGGELAWIETVSQKLGIPVLIPANGSNEIGLRIDAVVGELTKYIDGETPRLLISRHCTTLIKGFASKYRYKKRKEASGSDYELTPEKNDYSHPHDALQYLILGYRGRGFVVNEGNASSTRWNQGSAGGNRQPGGFNPHDV